MRKVFIVFVIVLSLTAIAIPSFALENDTIVIPVANGSIWYEGEFALGDYDILLYDNAMNVLVSAIVSLDGEDGLYEAFPFTYDGAECALNFGMTPDQCYADLVYNSDLMYSFVGRLVIAPHSGGLVSVADELGNVFTGIGAWLASALASLVAIFWTGTSLTIIGVLSVCALAVALILLVVAILRNIW